MDSHTEQEPTPAQPQPQAEDAAAFEHIKQGSDPYDAQTYGRCREGFFAHWVLWEFMLYDYVSPAVTTNSSLGGRGMAFKNSFLIIVQKYGFLFKGICSQNAQCFWV